MLAELRIPQVVVLGDGAGAYIALRSVLCQGIYIEEKAKVVAAVLGTYLNAALVFFPQGKFEEKLLK